MDIKNIQAYLNEHELDGWLLSDFHARNNIAVELLHLDGIVTRRSFYFIPAKGEPTGIVHAIEQDKFSSLPGELITYSAYKLMEKELASCLEGHKRLVMEYSPMGRLPYIGLVDAGTIELVKSFGIEIVSSADLVANFQARLTPEQIATHRIAANNLFEIKENTFDFIKKALNDKRTINEYDVVQYILGQFKKYDMTTAHPPICAVDSNAGNPHYEPSKDKSSFLKKEQLILLDIWAKVIHPRGVYGDITWMAYIGTADDIPKKHKQLFGIIVNARDTAVDYLRKHIDKQPVYGSEVDDVCRKVIKDAGYGEYFIHRTGHSITSTEHGPGPNIDNLETEDRRKLQKGHLFSIEPGIYMPDCGFRTEIDVLINYNGAEVTTIPIQTEITPLF